MLKLIALGTLGYLGYRHFSGRTDSPNQSRQKYDEMRLAGGPLSNQAKVVHPTAA